MTVGAHPTTTTNQSWKSNSILIDLDDEKEDDEPCDWTSTISTSDENTPSLELLHLAGKHHCSPSSPALTVLAASLKNGDRRPQCAFSRSSRRQVRSPQPNSRPSPPPSIPSVIAQGRAGASAPSPFENTTSPVPEDAQCTLEALQYLVTHCPDWIKRLDELCGQIDQRQEDLARLAEEQQQQQSSSSGRRSLRNSGSTESLKPKDDGVAHPGVVDGLASPGGTASAVQANGMPQQLHQEQQQQKEPPSGIDTNSPTSSAVERQTPQVMAMASANARAALRRTQLGKKRAAAAAAAGSMQTGDGAAPMYRSQSPVNVYYDSYVQSFFEEVVKFVSTSRNMMRKAKMAAKVAQIKKMAEMETPAGEDSDPEDRTGSAFGTFVPPRLSPSPTQVNGAKAVGTNGEVDGGDKKDAGKKDPDQTDAKPGNGEADGILRAASPSRLSYRRSNGHGSNGVPPPILNGPIRRSMAAAWAHAGPQQAPDALDELDKSLELVQSTCERAAHQFLRDGDCADEMATVKGKLTDTRGLADKEMGRMLEGDADGSLRRLLAEGPSKARTAGARVVRREPTRLRTSFTGRGPTPAVDGMNGANGAHVVGLTSDGAVSPSKGFGVDAGMLKLEVDEASEKLHKDAQQRPAGSMGTPLTAGP